MSFSRTKLAEELVKTMDKKSPKKLAKSIAAYLIDNGKTSELNSLARDIIERRDVKNHIVELEAISAHPLSVGQLKEIEKIVKQLNPDCRKVIINQTIDSSVIGGIRLQFANQLLDLTASAKLNKLRQLTT